MEKLDLIKFVIFAVMTFAGLFLAISSKKQKRN